MKKKKRQCVHVLARFWDVLLAGLTATAVALFVIIGAFAIINQL